MARAATYAIEISAASREELRAAVRASTAAQRLVFRSRIILELAEGKKNVEVAEALHTSVQTVCHWRKRFHEEGLKGLQERERSGRPASIKEQVKEAIVTRAVTGKEPTSCRKMAKAVGVSKATVQRLWQANDIRPHWTRTFKLSNDPRFEEKFWDVVGLYLHPPERALVLCCDEKSQCQALERTQPGLPLGLGHVQTRTHDYYRHGTTTLFAALNYLEGKIIGRMEARHTHVEWLRFLKQVDRETPQELEVHLIADNYSTHKHPKVKAWMEKHPRFTMHFTPTSASWMNLVERFFRDISQDCIRKGSFASVQELTDAILAYLAQCNQNPKRYVWKADGQKILDKIARARAVLAQQNNIQDI